jgi:hypothetical protein
LEAPILRIKRSLWIRALFGILLPFACTPGFFLFEHATAQASADSVVYLDQAWSQADREMFYQISQGSRAIAYDIFLNLEVAGSQQLFRSNENSERYGLITRMRIHGPTRTDCPFA